MIDRDSYREAMARLGAAVNIITTIDAGGPAGLTASAVCSVTDRPPTLLICINRDSETHDAFVSSGVLCVNTLTGAQEALSPVFAGMTGVDGRDRFQHGEWTTLETGAPVLVDAAVSFDCRVTQATEVGTHTVFFCAVEAIRFGTVPDGLIYFGRAYHRLTIAAA